MRQRNSRPWTSDDIDRLKTLAQTLPSRTIASRLGRSPAALAVKAHQLKLSLKVKKLSRGISSGSDPGPSGFDWK